jgi:hypothetical protein
MTRFQVRKKLRKACLQTLNTGLQSKSRLGIRKNTLRTLAILGLGTPGVVFMGLGTVGITQAEAAVISADTTGVDSGANRVANANNFFGVSFDNGPVGTFLKSFTFDLSSDSNAFFTNLPVPSLSVGSSNGVSASDVNFAISSDRKSLKATLADGAFIAGESLRFGVNTDGVGPSILGIDRFDLGADFGRAQVLFSTVLSNGTSGSAQFNVASLINPSRSVAVVNIADPQPVPEPFTILGSLAAGGFGVVLRRKQKQQQAQTEV